MWHEAPSRMHATAECRKSDRTCPAKYVNSPLEQLRYGRLFCVTRYRTEQVYTLFATNHSRIVHNRVEYKPIRWLVIDFAAVCVQLCWAVNRDMPHDKEVQTCIT